MRFFKNNLNSIFAAAKEENVFSLVERLESLRSELLPLASKEGDIEPANMIIEEIYEIIPLLEAGEFNKSHYWEQRGIDTSDLPLQATLDWVHSAYYGDDNIDYDEYKSSYMAVYDVLTDYTDLFVGRDWLDCIWRDRVLAA